MMIKIAYAILFSLLTVDQISNAQLGAEDYCDCLEFDRDSCYCGPQEGNNAVLIYCNGRNESRSFPAVENPSPASCNLTNCDIALVFEHYRLQQIPDFLFWNLVKSQQCVIRFVHRYNPDLQVISPNAFITGIAAVKEIFIEHTGLSSMESLAPALQNATFDCAGSTAVSFANNKLMGWLRPELIKSLKCVNSFSLNNNRQISIAMTALNKLQLTHLGLSNVSAQRISESTFWGSHVAYLDLSNNKQLEIKNSTHDDSTVIENLMLSISAKTAESIANSKNPLSPKLHLTCSRDSSPCGCIDMKVNGQQKTLDQLLKDCIDASNVCRPTCNASMFNIPNAVQIPGQYKEYLKRGVAFECYGNRGNSLQWYRLNDGGWIDPIEQRDVKIVENSNETTSISRLTIKDFATPLTALCLQKTNENLDEKLEFTLVAYPGDANAPETRNYRFSGKSSPQFQFNKTKSSLFKCFHAEEAEIANSVIKLASQLNHEGLFWSKYFNGTFCCHAINGSQQTRECALMDVSYAKVVSTPPLPPMIAIVVGAVLATVIIASGFIAVICYRHQKHKKEARNLREQKQKSDEEHQRLLEQYENIRSRLAKIYDVHIGQIPLTVGSRKSESNLPINAIVDELIFDRNSKTISRKDFSDISEKLGSGAFGTVWKGTLLANGEIVAIKTENRDVSHICNDNKSQQKKCERCQSLVMLIREAKVMQHIRPHPHVLQMVAVCTEKIKSDGSIYLLTEFCAGGELGAYLRKFTPATRDQLARNPNAVAFQIQRNSRYLIPGSAKVFLSKKTLLGYCSQIANGMDYLTSIPILHRDLGLYARNIIL